MEDRPVPHTRALIRRLKTFLSTGGRIADVSSFMALGHILIMKINSLIENSGFTVYYSKEGRTSSPIPLADQSQPYLQFP
jgi:hypothetical protein